MLEGAPVRIFTFAEPFPVALRMVRRTLARHGLRAPAELDIAARIRQEVGAAIAPCVVLYVDDPAVLLEAAVFNRAAALLIPQPVVVAALNGRTEVLVRSPESLAAGVPASVRDPLAALYGRIVRAVDAIAERQESHSTVNT